MKRVAILTTFYEAKSGYSLVAVAETQIRMSLDNGYEPVVIVQEGIRDEEGELTPFEELPPPSVWNRNVVDLRPVLPFMELTSGVSKDFEERKDQILKVLETNLADVDVCITHDIMLQDFYKEHNVAVREYAKTRPDLLWLHWIHSVPSGGSVKRYPHSCRYTTPPGYIIYPNDVDRPKVHNTYQTQGQEWRVIANRSGHAIDPLSIGGYSGLTKDLALRSDLLGGEVVAVYPARLDKGKQVEKIIRLMKGVKKAGYEPRLLVVSWQSSGDRFQAYIDELIALAKSLHIEDCISFSDRLDDRANQGVPRRVVTELMDLANVYIHPSRVETYSLVVHEAMLKGLLCCLNHDLAPMRELFGNNAIYFDFESDDVTREYKPSEQQFWNDEALRLLAELKQNRALWGKTVMRKRYSPQAMWREFEPLLALQAVGE